MLSCNVIRQPYYLDSELAFIAMKWKSCIVFFALGLNMRILNREGTAEVGMGISFMLGVGIIKLTTASCITVHTPRLPPPQGGFPRPSAKLAPYGHAATNV